MALHMKQNGFSDLVRLRKCVKLNMDYTGGLTNSIHCYTHIRIMKITLTANTCTVSCCIILLFLTVLFKLFYYDNTV